MIGIVAEVASPLRSMPHFIGTSKWLYFIIFYPYPNSIHLISPFFGVIDVRDVISSLSVSIFYILFLYIWKDSKSSYNNLEIAIEKKKEVRDDFEIFYTR
jgi:hypothetical protein